LTIRWISKQVSRMPTGERGRALLLVIERDPHVCDLEKYFLEEAGFAVEFAGDGLAALERAREIQPRIVITEILVPKLDGLALCRRLKEDPATQHIAVLVFSILMAAERAREAGADALLRKPLAETRLVDTVRALLSRNSGKPTKDANV
jgi:DNA-binding response OmpR family regulator